MSTHFLTLLEGIVAEPEQRIAQLPLLPADERHLLLEEWNRTTVATPQGCVHELFAEQVARTPDAVAVVFEDQQTTYAELNVQANQLAHYLRGRGVGPDVLVGVCCERTPELLVALLGVLKAGGAYIPLDPTYPTERIAFMLQDAGVPVLLTQEHLLPNLPPTAAHMVCLDRDWSIIATTPPHPHTPTPLHPYHLAYVIYTSGSTGLPKGVQITHRGLTNYLTWAVEEYHVAEGQGALVHSSISFDATITSLYTPLLVGKPVVLIPEQEEIEALSRVLQGAHHYSLVKITPAHLEALSYLLPEEAAAGGAQAYIIGGEALFERHIAFWRQHAPGVRMVNEYGPTETVVGCCVYTVPAGQLVGGAVPIGRPIANTQLYVLDAERQPVPLGVAGELYIGGAGVARGYLNRPELTAERFIPNPFGAGRLYKTGDMVRYLADGNLVYLGRLDSQVKIRGFRIELGEIEALLIRYPLVRAATVTVREERGEKRLVAYLVRTPLLSDEQTPHPREEDPHGRRYRDFLRRQLPEYMIPSAFVVLDALPLSPNGKVDHKALPAPATTDVGLRSHTSTEVALTPTEATLTTIWQQVLHLPHIGPDDNFFTIGGDSILSIQVVARARRLGIQITPRQLFQHQTIRQLSAVATAISQPAVIQAEITGSLPLTPIQHWFFAQGWPDVHHFNQAVLLEVAANLNVLHLQAALTALEHHHDALRLRFVQVEGVWRQENTPTTTGLDLAVFDLSTLTPEQRSARLAEEADRAQASLNLERGPLLRAAYVNYGDHEAGRLLVVIHHMAVDGVSWRILLEDWQLAYQQLLRGEAVLLPPKTTAFRDWARWLAIEGVVQVRREHAYWQRVINRCDCPLPVDHPTGPVVHTVASADEVVCTLDAETTALLLHTAPAAYHTQVNDLLLAALVRAVSQWSGQKRIALELEGHGREVLDDTEATTLDLSRTVGWFTSLFPVVLDVEADDDGGLIRSVKEQLRSIPNHGMGYGILRYMGALEGLVPAAPISLSFNYLGQFDAAIADTESPLRPSFAQEGSGQPHSPTGLLSHLLEINALVIHGELQVAWRFSRNSHQFQTIETLAAAYLAALRQLIDHCRTTAGGYTPSDFTALTLSQAELDRMHGQAIDDIYELSPMQEGMLFEALYAPESGVYVTQLCLTLERTLNVAAFRQSWQELVSHHPMLRTCFLWERDSMPLQLVQREVTLPWTEEQWGDGGDEGAALSAWLAADRQRGFALDQAPLMRCALLRTAGDAVYFVWTSHHLIGDGWSLPLLMQELFVRYQAACTGRAAEWPSPRPYRDYLLWLRRQDRQRAEIFWREQLHSFTAPTPLTVDRPAPTRGTQHDHYPTQRHVLSPELTRAVGQLAQQQQVTLNTVIQGAWAILLSRYSGNQEIIFGATISGRPATLPGGERMVGLFINTVPIAVTVSQAERLGPWLQRLQQTQAAAQEHGYFSLSDIQRGSGIPSGTPLFEHILVFENYPVDSAQLEAGAALVRDMASYEQTNYPLTIAVVPPGSGDEDRLAFAFSYDSRRLDAITITRMAGHLQTLIEGMVADPTAILATLPMLTTTEQQQLLGEWNATAADYPQDRCIHELFAEQAAQTPNAVAVVFENQQLTYAELNARANQLAHHLIGLGVGPDVLVGLCVERSREMIIGLLGILKAGGAYVPLDPSYPAERLAFMLDDAAVPVLLTQAHLLNTLPPTAAQVICLDRDWPSIAAHSPTSPHLHISTSPHLHISTS
ncbi:MAG: amino acid adenylation domain-containing protein, partial [Chloroflexales bacterium]